MAECFQDFLSDLKQSDHRDWEKLGITAGIIMKHWAKEKRLEMQWCANENGLLTEEEHIGLVLKELKMVLNKKINHFSDLKQAILRINEKLIDEGFQQFLDFVVRQNGKAWNALCKGLKTKIYKFLFTEAYSHLNCFDEIYQETLVVFNEKLAGGKLEFESSYKLKSFVLSIARLKLYEKFRMSKKQKASLWIDEMNYNLPEPGGYSELFEDREYASYLFKYLERKEKIVLYYYFVEQMKLKEIAKQMNMGEENCRVIKYRAIRKLRDVVGKNKEMQP